MPVLRTDGDSGEGTEDSWACKKRLSTSKVDKFGVVGKFLACSAR